MRNEKSKSPHGKYILHNSMYINSRTCKAVSNDKADQWLLGAGELVGASGSHYKRIQGNFEAGG